MKKRITYLFIILPVVFLILLLNLRLHMPGDFHTTLSQLDYLQNKLSNGAAEEMQSIFPEGYIFMWSLYGLSASQTYRKVDLETRRQQLKNAILESIVQLQSEKAKLPFVKDMHPHYGAFYHSWQLLVQGEYLRAVGVKNATKKELNNFQLDCEQFAKALHFHSTPFLPSYPGMTWPADTVIGVAALSIHDKILPAKYSTEIHSWLNQAKSLLNKNYQALGHDANLRTGEPIVGVRGSSLALMSRYLAEIDETFARQQYSVLRKFFVDYQWGILGVREYPKGIKGIADIDSGPIILGFSGPATVVAAAAAKANGDTILADRLLGMIEVSGIPYQWNGERKYLGGLMPMGDAFIAWARSTPTPIAGKLNSESAAPWWWPAIIHIFSLGLILLLMLPLLLRFIDIGRTEVSSDV